MTKFIRDVGILRNHKIILKLGLQISGEIALMNTIEGKILNGDEKEEKKLLKSGLWKKTLLKKKIIEVIKKIVGERALVKMIR